MIPVSCTAQQAVVVTTTSQPSTGSMTITLRNSSTDVNTTLSITIPASGAAGNYSDTTDTPTLTAADSYDWYIENNASSTSASIGSLAFQCK